MGIGAHMIGKGALKSGHIAVVIRDLVIFRHPSNDFYPSNKNRKLLFYFVVKALIWLILRLCSTTRMLLTLVAHAQQGLL